MNEHRMLCKDGNYKWILDRGKVVEWTDQAQPMRIIGTHTDITPRKLFEEQLRKAIEKEKELNDLKSRFVATASHEFRTPLASILMVSETLISYQKKMDELQISARLQKIKEHVLHLTNIVNDVLQLSKMQEGKIGFNPKDEDLIAMCRNIIDGFNSTILVKGNIAFSNPFKTLIGFVDNRLITQAISNLISNAIKYSVEDPKVIIELKLQKDELIFSVQDYGMGIPEQDQKHLCTPFFRAGNASTIQGNGLGLSIVRESVQMHGGNITFKSRPALGSTFTLHFPVGIISSYSFTE
jgi:signal transduction histidine kinase